MNTSSEPFSPPRGLSTTNNPPKDGSTKNSQNAAPQSGSKNHTPNYSSHPNPSNPKSNQKQSNNNHNNNNNNNNNNDNNNNTNNNNTTQKNKPKKDKALNFHVPYVPLTEGQMGITSLRDIVDEPILSTPVLMSTLSKGSSTNDNNTNNNTTTTKHSSTHHHNNNNNNNNHSTASQHDTTTTKSHQHLHVNPNNQDNINTLTSEEVSAMKSLNVLTHQTSNQLITAILDLPPFVQYHLSPHLPPSLPLPTLASVIAWGNKHNCDNCPYCVLNPCDCDPYDLAYIPTNSPFQPLTTLPSIKTATTPSLSTSLDHVINLIKPNTNTATTTDNNNNNNNDNNNNNESDPFFNNSAQLPTAHQEMAQIGIPSTSSNPLTKLFRHVIGYSIASLSHYTDASLRPKGRNNNNNNTKSSKKQQHQTQLLHSLNTPQLSIDPEVIANLALSQLNAVPAKPDSKVLLDFNPVRSTNWSKNVRSLQVRHNTVACAICSEECVGVMMITPCLHYYCLDCLMMYKFELLSRPVDPKVQELKRFDESLHSMPCPLCHAWISSDLSNVKPVLFTTHMEKQKELLLLSSSSDVSGKKGKKSHKHHTTANIPPSSANPSLPSHNHQINSDAPQVSVPVINSECEMKLLLYKSCKKCQISTPLTTFDPFTNARLPYDININPLKFIIDPGMVLIQLQQTLEGKKDTLRMQFLQLCLDHSIRIDQFIISKQQANASTTWSDYAASTGGGDESIVQLTPDNHTDWGFYNAMFDINNYWTKRGKAQAMLNNKAFTIGPANSNNQRQRPPSFDENDPFGMLSATSSSSHLIDPSVSSSSSSSSSIFTQPTPTRLIPITTLTRMSLSHQHHQVLEVLVKSWNVLLDCDAFVLKLAQDDPFIQQQIKALQLGQPFNPTSQQQQQWQLSTSIRDSNSNPTMGLHEGNSVNKGMTNPISDWDFWLNSLKADIMQYNSTYLQSQLYPIDTSNDLNNLINIYPNAGLTKGGNQKTKSTTDSTSSLTTTSTNSSTSSTSSTPSLSSTSSTNSQDIMIIPPSSSPLSHHIIDLLSLSIYSKVDESNPTKEISLKNPPLGQFSRSYQLQYYHPLIPSITLPPFLLKSLSQMYQGKQQQQQQQQAKGGKQQTGKQSTTTTTIPSNNTSIPLFQYPRTIQCKLQHGRDVPSLCSAALYHPTATKLPILNLFKHSAILSHFYSNLVYFFVPFEITCWSAQSPMLANKVIIKDKVIKNDITNNNNTNSSTSSPALLTLSSPSCTTHSSTGSLDLFSLTPASNPTQTQKVNNSDQDPENPIIISTTNNTNGSSQTILNTLSNGPMTKHSSATTTTTPTTHLQEPPQPQVTTTTTTTRTATIAPPALHTIQHPSLLQLNTIATKMLEHQALVQREFQNRYNNMLSERYIREMCLNDNELDESIYSDYYKSNQSRKETPEVSFPKLGKGKFGNSAATITTPMTTTAPKNKFAPPPTTTTTAGGSWGQSATTTTTATTTQNKPSNQTLLNKPPAPSGAWSKSSNEAFKPL